MIKVKSKDFVKDAYSTELVEGGVKEVKASEAVEEEGILYLYKRDWKGELVEVSRFYPQDWESWEKV